MSGRGPTAGAPTPPPLPPSPPPPPPELDRPAAPYLVHAYHSKVRDWSKSADGMSLGPEVGTLGRGICHVQGSCLCPPGTNKKEVALLIKEELGLTINL